MRGSAHARGFESAKHAVDATIITSQPQYKCNYKTEANAVMPVAGIPKKHKNRIRQLAQALKNAATYTEWRTAALELDVLQGNDRWRAEDASPFYPYELLREQIQQMENLRSQDDSKALVSYMQESLHRTLGELVDPNLYNRALAGSKFLIRDYLDQIEITLNYLCCRDFPDLPFGQKRQLFKNAAKNFGCSALMLSGGGAFGIYHFGIIKTLLQHRALPRIISGTSMGAIVAGVVGTHTDEELIELFKAPEQRRFDPIRLCAPGAMLKQGHVLNPEQLLETISANIPALTFLEAYRRTGRIINITVSPTRSGQKPRILNYKTAPDVLIPHSCCASSSIPGLYPALKLKAKNAHNEWVDYMQTERWADGGVHTDIPMGRIGRMHNVNHFIVSQTNPHVLPFIKNGERQGVMPYLLELTTASIHAQWHQAIGVTKKRTGNRTLRFWLDRADTLLGQDYLGDINIHPDFPFSRYLKVMANPSEQEIKSFILAGERATWPKLPMIINQTRISRVLQDCNDRLREQDRRKKV